MIAGGTLRDHIRRLKRPKLKLIKKWSKQILSGIAYLHGLVQPIIHRDLNCDNIFIDVGSGEIIIGDLGLSTNMQNKHNKAILDTPEFMAPEVYEERYDTSADIYTFGMTLLEMVTKSTPYSECANFM